MTINTYKEPLLATTLVVLALFGGYKHKLLSNLWKEFRSQQSEQVNENITPDSTDDTAESSTTKTPLKSGKPLTFGVNSSQSFQSSSAAFGVENPYKNSFASTLDAIRPGEIEKKQEQKRNLYFDHLREQLKELQGGTPPTSEIKSSNANTPEPIMHSSSSSATYGSEVVQIPQPDAVAGDESNTANNNDHADEEDLVEHEPSDNLDNTVSDGLEQNE